RDQALAKAGAATMVDAAAATQRVRSGRSEHVQLSDRRAHVSSPLRVRKRGAPRGFTMLEVLIAAVLLVIALVGSLALTVGLLRGNQSTRYRDTAYFLAQQALDQYSATPILQIPTLLPGVGAPTDTPICYDMNDAAFIDHPVTCDTVASNYDVRVMACCVGPGMPATPAPAVSCANLLAELRAGTMTLPPDVNFAATGQGVSCILQAEVTWPSEQPGYLIPELFSDSLSAPPKVLNFQNH